jgi:hypothetical protein
MRNVSDKICRENQNTHFMFNNSAPLKKNHAIYELTKITVQPDRPQTYVVLNALLPQQWLHKCASVLCYMYIVCLVCLHTGNIKNT